MKRLLLMTIILFIQPVLSSTAELRFKGYVQGWFSYTKEHSSDGNIFGFTLRRVRFKPFGSFSKSVNWVLHFGWDKQVARLIDAYLDIQISKPLALRIGQFTVPGTISSSLTSSAKLDLVERPEITQKWNEYSGLSSFRSIGIQVHGAVLNNKMYYALMVANPKTFALFTPSIKETEYTHENNGFSLWGRMEARVIKGLRMGTFFGNTQEYHNGVERNSFGAHLFFIRDSINFKCEYIVGNFCDEERKIKYSGMYCVLGYKISKFEPILRFGTYTPNHGSADEFGVELYTNYTLGLNYFLNRNIKIQINHVIRDELMAVDFNEKIKNNLFYIHLQYSF